MSHPGVRSKLRRFVKVSNDLHRAHLDTAPKRQRYGKFVDIQLGYFLPRYDDLRGRPGYGPAIDFIVTDLVGPGIADRDRDLEKVVPIMSRTMPAGALAALATAMELNAGILEINLGVAGQLADAIDAQAPISERDYCLASRKVAGYEDFTRFIAMTREAGLSLERIVQLPMIRPLLRTMRGPARLAGVADLQAFLEKGFETFRDVDDVPEFLEIIETRMAAVFHRVFIADPDTLSTTPIGARPQTS